MTDQAPLIFARKLGMLAPVNGAAREALAAIDGQCTVRITKATRNQRRRSLYWCVNTLVADALNDLHGLTLTEQDLHDLIRRKLGYYEVISLPSGDKHVKLRSTSDRSMTEPERAKFMERAFAVYSNWLGIPVADLLTEVKGRE